MNNLSVYLPPFSGDYSGACSALYDINCLIVLCDASCCTKNYINYEEPRWSPEKRTTMCAQLRTLQIIMGDDSRIISQAADAAKDSGAELIALLGSPVPAITGMDMKGMACEVEKICGIPAVGLNTTGFSDYCSGIEQAQTALFERFVPAAAGKIKNGINILGATPIDLGNTGNEKKIEQAFEEAGYNIICNFSFGCSLDDIERSAAAELNAVVTASGIALAKKMREEAGIPYIAGVPIGRCGVREMLSSDAGTEACPDGNGKRLLIVGDQVISVSIRRALKNNSYVRPIDVVSFFKMHPELMCGRDKKLSGEKNLIELIKSGDYDTVMGDPLLKRIPQMSNVKFYELPHPAVSGPFGWDAVPGFTSEKIEALIEQICKELKWQEN